MKAMKWSSMLVSAVLAAIVLVGCGPDVSAPTTETTPAAGDEGKKDKNLLVITLDTTRADRLGCYGHEGIKTPNIDALAQEGVLFEEAFAVQPVTLPSHCSIFTGLYPYSHGVRDNNLYKLPENYTTLAEVLLEREYLTTAFISSYILDRQFGLNQGFHYYNDKFVKPKQKGRLPVDRRASEVSFLARDWLDELKEPLAKRPFFLWLHYYDPHADYDPPHPYGTAYPDPYDGEIAYTDDWIGYFFDELKARDLWKDTIVVVVADHGESLGEYGEKTHGMFIYRPTTHVPLIVRHPDALPKGKRISERVSTVDIMPTLLDLVGVEEKPPMDGKSLLPLIKGEPYSQKRDIYSEVFIPRSFNWSELKGIRNDDRFYIDAPKPELYLLEPGKNETVDMFEKEPTTVATMAGRLEKVLSESSPPVEEVVVSKEMEDQLEALGYFLAGGEHAHDLDKEKSLPDPKDRIGLFNLHQRANGFAAGERREQAVRILEALVEQDPSNPRFLMELGDNLVELGRYEEAKKHLTAAIQLNPEDGRVRFLMGRCLEGWGKKDEALDSFAQAAQKDSNHFLARYHMGMIYIERQNWDRAKSVFTEARRIKPGDPGVLNNLGYIEIKGFKDFQSGIRLIELALKAAPKNPFILGSLGSAYLEYGSPKMALTYLEHAVDLIPDNRQLMGLLEKAYMQLGDDAGVAALRKRSGLLDSR